MRIIKEILNKYCAYLLIHSCKLEYCLQHYDEMMQQLNQELDNCNYFGEDVCHDNIVR